MTDLAIASRKFTDPDRTATGEPRARIALRRLETLWVNTGTLCNIACANCYIESSPTNDRLVYFTRSDLEPFLDELAAAGETGCEIGFTGGEPFMAPDMLAMMEAALDRGHPILVLTNAMKPMMRQHVQTGLERLAARHRDRILMRVSLDHHTARNHDRERGAGSFAETLRGVDWLARTGFEIAIAGRRIWGEQEGDAKAGYRHLAASLGINLDVDDPRRLVLFPEMTPDADPPEITPACWNKLGVSPEGIMCASQRMLVRRKGAARASVVACTLIPYDPRFELGGTLSEARRDVALNHPFCASFCVLGGGSCSA